MTRIFSAFQPCEFAGRKILFDTNVWIAINGFDPSATRPAAYSDYYGEVLKSDNQLVVNDYVLGEFFNRSCKLEYEIRKKSSGDDKFPHFKQYRQSEEFKEFAETVRDTCQNMIDDGVFEPVGGVFDIHALLDEASAGRSDFTDIVLREHCKAQGYVVVSHDRDFANCGLDLVTANKRMLVQ